MKTSRPALGATAVALILGAPTIATAAESFGLSAVLDEAFQPIRDAQADLAKRGIHANFGYLIEPAYNFDGGDDEKFDAAGEAHGGATFDLEHIAGLTGSSLTLWITKRHGTTITKQANLGNFEQLQQIAGRGQVTRVTRLFWKQEFYDNAANVKIGLFPQSDDFDSFGCDFVGLAFCGHQIGDFIGDTVFQYPISNPAVVGRINLTDDVYINGGAFGIYPERLGEEFFEDNFGLPGTINGVYFPLQLGWHWDIGEQNLPGDYQIGGWYESANTPNNALDDSNVPFLISGNDPKVNENDTGMWLWGKQQVTQHGDDPNRGLFIEANVLLLDDDRTFADRAISTKITYQGPFDSRPRDIVGLGYSQIKVASAIQNAERQFNAVNPGSMIPTRNDFEHQIDLMYRYSVTPELYVQLEPAVIFNPGGFGDDTVWAMQGRFAFDF